MEHSMLHWQDVAWSVCDMLQDAIYRTTAAATCHMHRYAEFRIATTSGNVWNESSGIPQCLPPEPVHPAVRTPRSLMYARTRAASASPASHGRSPRSHATDMVCRSPPARADLATSRATATSGTRGRCVATSCSCTSSGSGCPRTRHAALHTRTRSAPHRAPGGPP